MDQQTLISRVPRRRAFHRICGMCLAALAGTVLASAQTTTYTGGPGPSDFTTAANWDNGAPLNQNAVIPASTGALTLTLSAPAPDPYPIDSLTVQGNNALTFDQSGGTLAVATGGALNFGTSNSIYNLSGGTLQVGGANGIAGSATVNLAGGTLQAAGAALTSNTPTVLVANTTSTIDTTNFDASLNNMSGSGSLNKIGGGNLNVGGAITLGAGGSIASVGSLNFGTSNAAGTLTLNAGSSVVVTGESSLGATAYSYLQVGYGGTGTLNVAGGTISMSTLGGNLSIFTVGQADTIGNAGHGIVNFSSGSMTLGYAGETDGNYGTIIVGNGLGSTATFNQSGGTVTGNGGAIEIGVGQAMGTYALTNAASLTMGVGSTTYIGDSVGGIGLLHVSGNSTFAASGQIYLGTSGGTGMIEQDGAGSVVTIASGASTVAFGRDANSVGNYDLSAGALNIVSGVVYFGYYAGSIGNLNQTGGTLTADVVVILGINGTGNYNISSGTGTFNAGLTLAQDPAGSLGVVNQTGGMVTITGGALNLDLPYTPGVNAIGSIYNLDGGTLQVGGANGINGFGTLALGGGTVQVIGSDLTTGANTNLALSAGTRSTLDTNGFNATLSGPISGSGGLVKTGLGTAILSGANTYSGGTTINGGTIQAGSASALGSASGSLSVNNGTFDLNGFNTVVNALNGATTGTITSTSGVSTLSVGNANGSGTFAGVLAANSGLYNLVKNGTGTEVLTGANTYNGGTAIQAGTLTAGSASALGTGSLILIGGVLGAGNGNQAINVGGDYLQITGATLSLTLDSPTVHDDLTVAGTATLGGTLHLTFASGSYPIGSSVDLIQTGGLNDTTFNNLVISGPEQGMLEYTGTDVSVLFTGRTYLSRTAGLNPNQTAVASYIDDFSTKVTKGNFGVLVDNIYPLSTNASALGAALNQISPQSLQVLRSIAFDNATFDSQQINDHLANLRDGLTGFDGSQLSVMDSTLDPTLSQINGRLLAWNPDATPGLMSDVSDPFLGGIDMKDLKATRNQEASETTSPWSTFVAGNVVLADLSHNEDVEHQDYTTGSVKLGADYRLDSHFTVGALVAYGHTDATLDHNGSSATVDSYSPGVYASYVDGGWYGNGLFSYGYNSYTEDRNISIGTLNGTNTGAPQGNQYTGNLTGGYEFQRGGWKFGPVASLQYVNLGIDSFSEEGPTALNIQNQSDDSLRSQFGIEARYALKTGSVIMTPHLSASWQHEFLDNSDGITSQFNQVGSGSFTVQTTNPQRDSAFIDLGLDAQVAKELTLFVDYQTEAGQSDFFAQSVQAGLKIGF